MGTKSASGRDGKKDAGSMGKFAQKRWLVQSAKIRCRGAPGRGGPAHGGGGAASGAAAAAATGGAGVRTEGQRRCRGVSEKEGGIEKKVGSAWRKDTSGTDESGEGVRVANAVARQAVFPVVQAYPLNALQQQAQALQQQAMQQHAMQQHALQQHAMQQHALQQHALQQQAMQQQALQQQAMHAAQQDRDRDCRREKREDDEKEGELRATRRTDGREQSEITSLGEGEWVFVQRRQGGGQPRSKCERPRGGRLAQPTGGGGVGAAQAAAAAAVPTAAPQQQPQSPAAAVPRRPQPPSRRGGRGVRARGRVRSQWVARV